jgi:hypothetical protein
MAGMSQEARPCRPAPQQPSTHQPTFDGVFQIAGIGRVEVRGMTGSLAEQNETVKEIVATVLGVTLGVSLGIYLLVRAIGWVIGGFASP